MELSPPVKPPRGVKPVKETSGLLMSVIRTLSSSETNEQRDKEKSKLETEYKNCDRKLDELVSKHESDLAKVMQQFAAISQIVSDNRLKIAKVKEHLQDCKRKLRCRRDELRNLWLEGLEYKYMLQLLDEIEKMSQVPDRLSNFMSHKQYLHATELLVEAVTLGKNTLEGVESLKELSRELEQKKEQLHLQLFAELKEHLFTRPAQRVLALRRQESGRDNFLINSPLQRSTELRLSRNRMAVRRNIFESAQKLDNFNVVEDLTTANPEENSYHFIVILIKCLALLDKLPFAVSRIKEEMQVFLLGIIQRSTQHIKDFAGLQTETDYKQALKELVQTLFEQFKEVAEAQLVFLRNVEEAAKVHNTQVSTYSIQFYWTQVQSVLEIFLNEYLDVQNTSTESHVSNKSDANDLSSYFGRRKQPIKKKSLFKFDSSSSALTLSSTLKSTKKDKILVCRSHSNNILIVFIPFMCFIEEVEQVLGQNGPCQLHRFITQYVSEVYLKRKSDEIIEQIETAVRAADAWKATVLLDCTADYKPLLVSTASVERCIREWKAVLQALPIYSERIAVYSCKALKEYKDTCFAAYSGIVQPHSEDRRICSAAWLKDEDISRFLKSLPNWVNLKAQQEYHARSERIRRALRREQRSEEESPEDVRKRNRREAEILASNLGEGGVSASEILSDMALLKELAQLQESMEWFSVRMFQYTSEFRHEPAGLSPSKPDSEMEGIAPVSGAVLQQLTSLAQEFDELANTCLLLLHLEVRVQCFHYLLAQTHLNRETHEPDPKVLELSRVLANVDEAVTSSLHPRKCKYIFEGLGHLIAKILISSAQYLQTIDEAGIQRMCRNIFALQQTLTNITMTRELALDHARHYFELFFLTPEEILNGIVEKGPEFSELEYMNAFQLLNRSQADREHGSVTVHLERLSDILGEVGMTV
ncbi:Exocyst complex component 4-like Protein [Tribolium castaneum]|uniref:Exocyst complex component Sec8 n=1 Tax=Tribolium castaneum TaxID=7070 RepID=D6X531_TRICA|nr:PREDICTED: exocyst complex component 4 [Tribolium castaneum]EEZ97195.1 Exocyst complex component 4-like Protein [Tribolium castaneum]|eukprot:XP_008200316.1 PREDICTED: exocyst complex component 4 [Tribolium castaneum]